MTTDTGYLIRLNTGKVHRTGCPLAAASSEEFGPWDPGRPVSRAAANSSCSYCLKGGLPPVPEKTPTLSETRIALRREVGPPRPDDGRWNPMISAGELRQLLDVLDRLEDFIDTARALEVNISTDALADLLQLRGTDGQ